jgi:Zn-dependent M28 family amino/carboxypeptidase
MRIDLKSLMMAGCFLFRDAWSLGAIDPTSGTATLLEITRVLGVMYKNGIYPCSC